MSHLPFSLGNHSQATQQAQQAAFTQNAQLPGIDMATVLQGITPEQLAYIGQLYQSGQIPFPPAQNVPSTQVIETGDDDLEDGEYTPQAQPGFLHPPPTGPRKRSGSVHMRPDHNGAEKRAKRELSPPRQPKGYDRRRPETSTDKQAPSRSQARQRVEKRDATQKFILTLHNAGYGFDDILREVGDATILRVHFDELGLNAPGQKLPPKQSPSTSILTQAHKEERPTSNIVSPAQGSPPNTITAKPAIRNVAKPAAVVKAPATTDRSAYLAKLQAAKNKKNEALATNAIPSPITTLATSEAPQTQQAAVVSAEPVQSQPVVQQPKKAILQTELVRKRLEALRSEQARKQQAERVAFVAATSEPNATPLVVPVKQSLPETPTRSTNITSSVITPDLATTVNQQDAIAPTQATAATTQGLDFMSQFPGLPGLFMTGTPSQQSVVPAVPQPLRSSNSATLPTDDTTVKQPSPADHVANRVTSPPTAHDPVLSTKPSVTSSGQATPKHPFNQNRHTSNDDSVIIQVSDEEEEESELDDLDEEEEVVTSPAVPTPAIVAKPGPLHNLPAPVASAIASAPTTPGATTPGGLEYQKKLQEISEMHRRIAELQSKTKAKPTQPTMPATTATHATNTLPGLTPTVDSSPAAASTTTPHAEQQLAEASQQMEAELAQLKEEAGFISEQRQKASQAVPPTVPEHTDPAPSSDDDDDAMDLSSGDEREPDIPVVANDPAEVDIHDDSASPAVPAGTRAEEPAMMHDSSSDSDDSDDSEDESEDDYEPAPAAADANATSANQVQSPTLDPDVISSTPLSQAPMDVDLAPELQPSNNEQAPSNATFEAPAKPHYKPYESPLKMFKDYRFHPQFTSIVKTGYKSLTYSNKLDPLQTMCPSELSSGTCYDKSCPHQHFRDTSINDGDLLKQLGTHNAPWKTEEEKMRWNIGLTQVVKQLRETNQGTDVNAIAARIAQYRRDFIGIPYRVLNLDSKK